LVLMTWRRGGDTTTGVLLRLVARAPVAEAAEQ
jgi:hypothetical protein